MYVLVVTSVTRATFFSTFGSVSSFSVVVDDVYVVEEGDDAASGTNTSRRKAKMSTKDTPAVP
jgi:hypothetical protein